MEVEVAGHIKIITLLTLTLCNRHCYSNELVLTMIRHIYPLIVIDNSGCGY